MGGHTMEKEIFELQKKINCQASSVWLKEGDTLYPYIFFGEGSDFLRNFSMKSDQGICGFCVTHNVEIMSNDLRSDKRWSDLADRKSGFTTRNIICFPIVIYDEVYGCVQLLNKIDGDFTEEDVKICREIIDYIIENL